MLHLQGLKRKKKGFVKWVNWKHFGYLNHESQMLLNLNTVPNLDSKQSLIFLLRHGSEDRMPTACSLYQISWQKTHTQVKKWLETSVSLPSTTDSTVAMTWQKNWRTISIIIWCKFLILFIGQGPIMWPTNNGPLMGNVVLLCFAANNILLMRKWNHTFLLLALAIALAWQWQIDLLPKDIHNI